MVVFTCNNCGETLQKPKVTKHYEFACRTALFLTCVDCFKDFRGEEFVKHTKCITEAERYGGKDYIPKSGANKGEKKQQEWINIVNNILSSDKSLSELESSFLVSLSKYENIPRKKAKFLNFINNAMGRRINPSTVESVWIKMEEAYKNNTQNIATKQSEQDSISSENANVKNDSMHLENNVIENQNNENIDKEIQKGNEQTKVNGFIGKNSGNDNISINAKKKKSKKRVISETVQETEESNAYEKGKHVVEGTEEPIAKKKRKSTTTEQASTDKDEQPSLPEVLINQYDDSVTKSAFNWKSAILELVQSKEEISLKKLQKKVIAQYMNFCSNTVTSEKAISKFNKKLRKTSEVVVSDDKVKLA